MERRRSSRDRAPRRSSLRVYSSSVMPPTRACRFGSSSSSHSQSTMSSMASSSTNCTPPGSVMPWPLSWPLAWFWGTRNTSPGDALPCPAAVWDSVGATEAVVFEQLHRYPHGRWPPPKTSALEMISGRRCRTASRTFSLWRSQSRAPREKRSQCGTVLAPRVISSFMDRHPLERPSYFVQHRSVDHS